MSYKTIQDIIAQSQALQKMHNHSLFLQQLTTIVMPLLSEELKAHVRIADYQDTILFLELTNPAYGLALRFQIPALLQTLCLKQPFYRLREIKYYVQPRQD